MFQCECSDQYCEDQKIRSEICRPQVMKSINEPVVSCRVAQWICEADTMCATALDYYNRFCKSMFHGKKCTLRCNNSISILRRQEKAAKLTTCKCDGKETYDCHAIRHNMAKLCFGKPRHSSRHNTTSSTTTTTTHHPSVLVGEEEIPTVVLASTSNSVRLLSAISSAVMMMVVIVSKGLLT